MSQNKIDLHGIDPGTISGNLESSITSATWLADSDLAALMLARRLAKALDVAFDQGEMGDVTQLSQRFIGVLQQLHLTVETRKQGKQESENDGSGHVGDYLRLLQATPTKSKPKPA